MILNDKITVSVMALSFLIATCMVFEYGWPMWFNFIFNVMAAYVAIFVGGFTIWCGYRISSTLHVYVNNLAP